ncbi:hypothetical protein M569_14354 [Genlisea aurea]|uniref:Annexin n=1 Tax=Genlisea aurea TaxID=192259 RepID=S8C194_9LAMI|nr:hypothetical protein M569_14354 [Genlisea aurea]
MATIRIPQAVPSPSQDCEKLRKAFQGFGTDEKSIIWILAHRNSTQRNEIRETYRRLYNASLLDDLRSELSGDFRASIFQQFLFLPPPTLQSDQRFPALFWIIQQRAVTLWTYEAAERDARLANEALSKSRRKNTIRNLQPIVETACATSPHHLIAVRKAYCSLFDSSLEEDIIASHLSPPIQKILVSLVGSYRYDKQAVDSTLARIEAAKLHEAIEARKLDDHQLMLILSTRNVFQLRQTFKFYIDAYGKSIHKEIKACGNGLLESVIRVAALCIDSPEIHFAEVKLHREKCNSNLDSIDAPHETFDHQVVRSSIVGLGTDEDSLSRAIVTRAEIDLMNIKEAYLKEYKVSMEDDVIGDTSGDYKNFLLSLLGSNM